MPVIESHDHSLPQAVAIPNNAREQLLGMELIRDQSVLIDTDQSIYPPSSIGLPSREAKRRLSVVAELAVPIIEGETGEEATGHAVLIKIKHQDGSSAFAL